MLHPSRWILVCLLAAGLTRAEPWPEVATDLTPDPALHEGRLSNGVRYLILRNAEPRNHVSLRLVVAAGSLHENADERGLAHFIEHMAFRGTRAHPAGSLTEALQRLGVGFGPDNTAFTSYGYTIYHLELPDAAAATLTEGLSAFREYAEAIAFDEKMIELERGVVLSERANRDTPQGRATLANLAFLWPGAREIAREPIGTLEALRSFKRAQFTAFYDAWYRPERLALIIVGDLDPAMAERQVTELFSPLTARAPARPEPLPSTEAEAGPPDVDVFTDPNLPGFTISLEHPQFFPRRADTHAERVRELHQALAFAMFQSRLVRIAHQPDAAFLAPTATVAQPLRDWRVVGLGANGKANDWKVAASQLEQEHRRAFQFGFTAAELGEARAVFANAYEQSVRSASTRASPVLAQQLAGIVLNGGTFVTPLARQQDLAHDLSQTTLQDCQAAFRAAWTNRALSVYIAANSALRVTRAELATTLNASRAQDVTSAIEAATGEFAYQDFGPAGKLAHEEKLPDLDLRLNEFANGVRFNFKATSFESDIVDVHVRVGEGQITQPEDKPGLNMLATSLVLAGGLGRHSVEDFGRILAGHLPGLTFEIQPDACTFRARCARRDLTTCLQLITAYLTDAAYRPEAVRDSRARIASAYAALSTSPSRMIAALAPRQMVGDRRFGMPRFDEVSARDLGELKAWLEPQFKHGAIEMSVVGDLSWEEAETAVARTLGTLPARERRSQPAVIRPLTPGKMAIVGLDAAAKQSAAAWYWPVSNTDIHDTRRCHLLARVLADRFRRRLREELGASYSLDASFLEVQGFPHLNHFVVYAEFEPQRLSAVLEILEREVRRLSTDGPTEDEFARIKPPYAADMTANLLTNVYWGVTVLSDAQEHPARIAAARDRTADVAKISHDELVRAARRYLPPAKAFKFAALRAMILPTQTSGSSAAGGTTAQPR